MFGDDTAQRAGRLTLNPVKHIDPFGTVILPLMLILVGAPGFGYAKPVPVNQRRMRSPRNHGLLVSLVGPGVNVAIALLVVGVLRFLRPDGAVEAVVDHWAGFRFPGFGAPPILDQGLFALGLVNVILAAFNLLPIPPLDGSAVIERVLPARWFGQWLRFRQYSMILLLIVVLLLPGALDRVFTPALRLWSSLLG